MLVLLFKSFPHPFKDILKVQSSIPGIAVNTYIIAYNCVIALMSDGPKSTYLQLQGIFIFTVDLVTLVRQSLLLNICQIMLLLQVVENVLHHQKQAQQQVKQARTSYYSLLLRKQQEEKELKENLESFEDQVFLYASLSAFMSLSQLMFY